LSNPTHFYLSDLEKRGKCLNKVYHEKPEIVPQEGVCQIWGEFFQRLEVAATRALNLPFGWFISVLVGAGLRLHLQLPPN
jgi:hypothetical protein